MAGEPRKPESPGTSLFSISSLELTKATRQRCQFWQPRQVLCHSYGTVFGVCSGSHFYEKRVFRPVDYCRGRDDPRGSPPAQIRTSASTHTALTKDGWRRSVHRDKGAERGVEESTGSRLGSNVPNTSLSADCGGPEHSAIADTREV